MLTKPAHSAGLREGKTMLLMIEKQHRRPWGFEQGRYPI